MRRIFATFWVVATLLAALAAAWQKPDDLLALEGNVIADYPPSYAFLLRNLAIAEYHRAGRPAISSSIATLDQAATAAFFSNRHNDAARYFLRLLVALRGDKPGEWLEVASSFRFQLDRRIAAPGTLVHAALSPVFLSTTVLAQPVTVKISILDAGGKAVLTLPSATLERIEERDIRLVTRGLPEGAYSVRYALHDHAGKFLAGANRPLLLDAKVQARVQALEQQADRLAAAAIAAKSPRHAAAVETVLHFADLYRRALSQPVASFHQNLHPLVLTLAGDWPPVDSTDPIAPDRDLAFAEATAAALLKGGDPLATATGHLRLGYRSGVERPFEPYRLYVPPNYDAARKWPLIVALRSDTGDEGSLFDLCPPGQESQLLSLARERGYIVVSPGGMGPYSYFSGTAADDVFRVISLARSIVSIDDANVYVAGNAMGGMGGIILSLDERARFNGVAAVAAAPLQRYEYKRAPGKPLLLLQPGASRIMSPRESRVFAFLLAKYYKQFDYDEIAGADHFAVFASSLPRIFAFFDSVRNGTWKPSGRPIPLPEDQRRLPER
ncbi:MAG: hypothetical protein HY821_08960 [Acidobacteria bacterium]|nr:hypothetical protein [Acidobacteriota bacterium]